MIPIKKPLIICWLLILILLLPGCYNYTDINRLIFVTAYALDIDEDNNIVMYVEAFKPTRSYSKESGREEKILLKQKSKTVQDVVRHFNLVSNSWMNYSQNLAIIFSERAAKKGLTEILDFIDREQSFLLRPNVYVYYGNLDDLFKLKQEEELFLGSYISEITETQENTSSSITMRLNEFLNMRLGNKYVYLLPRLELRKSINTSVTFNGGYVFKEDKAVEFIDRDQFYYLNLLMGKFKRGILVLPHPEDPNSFVVLDILGSKTKRKLAYVQDKIQWDVNVTMDAVFIETQKPLEFTKENLDIISKTGEQKVASNCQKVFKRLQEKDIDIFNINQDFQIAYPKSKIKDVLPNTQINLKVTINLNQTEDTTNFR